MDTHKNVRLTRSRLSLVDWPYPGIRSAPPLQRPRPWVSARVLPISGWLGIAPKARLVCSTAAARCPHQLARAKQRANSAVRALLTTLRYYRGLGIRFSAVLTDHGACCRSRRFAAACRRLGRKHRRTRAYRPRTNGKAERLIQTALHEWVYAYSYQYADERAAYLPRWLHDDNWHRPHSSLNHQPPISRMGSPMNNLVGLHI